MGEPHVECLLQVAGDTTALNTFDKLFRSGIGPQWSDRPSDGTPRYSLHALFPVPENIQLRGYQAAGHLWCDQYWDTPDDIAQVEVKRLLGERRYRFYTQKDAPKNVFWIASANFPTLRMGLALLGVEKHDFQRHSYCEGTYQACYAPHDAAENFAALREEMGFAA